MRAFLQITGFMIAALVVVPASAAIKVVSTLPDYGALVQALGGEHVTVRVLASPSEDPHFVDAKPSFIVALNRADLLIATGLEQEIGWLPNLIVQSRNQGIQSGQSGHLEMGAHVKRLLDIPTGSVDRSMGDIHMGGNPHFYHDPARMLELLPVLANRLIELDPSHRAVYKANLAQQEINLKALIEEVRKQFDTLSARQRKVVAYHKSLSYLFETLGITVVAYLEPKPGVAPTPSHIGFVLALMKREGLGVVVQEEYYPSKTSTTLARLVQGQVVLVSGGTRKGQTYPQHIREVTTRLFKALAGKSS